MTVNISDHSTGDATAATPLPPVLGFAAFSGTGKTTLLCGLIPELRARGLKIALVKHSHHAFEVDHPGKDSYLLRQAGAEQLVLASRRRTVVFERYRQDDEPDLIDFLRRIANPSQDLLLVEGYKRSPIPKIELHRPSLGHPLLALVDPHVIAVASDGPLPDELTVPILDINSEHSVADFIVERYLPNGRCVADKTGATVFAPPIR